MTDWVMWRKHIDQVVKDHGQWVGLCDDNGEPIMDLPVSTLNAKSTLRKPADGELAMPTLGSWGQVHKAVDMLVADGLGAVDGQGELVAHTGPQPLLVVERKGGRSAYLVTHPMSPVDAFRPPDMLTIPSVNLLDMLSFWPAPSVPSTWLPGFEVWEEDAAGPYATPRTYVPVEFATAADGYTLSGPAERVIQETIQDSLDSVNHLMGWSGDPHMVVDWQDSGIPSEEVLLRVQDQPVLDTVQDRAADAGVNITVDLWWPGDDPVLVRNPDRTGSTLTLWENPMTVVRVRQVEVKS